MSYKWKAKRIGIVGMAVALAALLAVFLYGQLEHALTSAVYQRTVAENWHGAQFEAQHPVVVSESGWRPAPYMAADPEHQADLRYWYVLAKQPGVPNRVLLWASSPYKAQAGDVVSTRENVGYVSRANSSLGWPIVVVEWRDNQWMEEAASARLREHS